MSSILKRHAEIEELLGLCLTFVARPADVDVFRFDMRTLNSTLFKDSLKELIRTGQLKGVPIGEQRSAIQRVYVRKVKELSSLYPVLFAVESGLRGRMAERVSEITGNSLWWQPFWTKYRAQGIFDRALLVSPIALKNAFKTTLERIMTDISLGGRNSILDAATHGDELYRTLSLSQLQSLIVSDWVKHRSMFTPAHLISYRFDENSFRQTMRIVLTARNEVFHGNPISDRGQVMGACERLLNAMDFHLGDYDADVGRAVYTRTAPMITRSVRHKIPAR